ncbi:tRNA glutamyl-Q(34) synthetase GluQRS [Kineobactrum salinum]|uniref:Glutamyl-Q tRNA(Asp) synthetase n=1 Tax=Kineobactrum salinum TaxID=2708301 RepID=A0A6C0U3C4_9GAMM|nr:tRNA glutamyl-Q(34) synthetase GluQRS [Kineobactrum salinum]QIB64865.1 tRNA glutamyl-Q(34) synthetase GluQRS [Kineobactrum salinum]
MNHARHPPDPYRGRFAPSPTGPLHLGSLIAALASWLEARSAGGQWLLRMEDIDPPREQPGAARDILRSLQAHGLYWDEDVLWQSRRGEAYDAALDRLHASGALFACRCSRRQQGPGGSCGSTCRGRSVAATGQPFALRVKVPPDYSCRWRDPWQGEQYWPLGQQLTDFIVRRRDGLYAYQLAVVVDDAAQQVSHVVRGSDLLDSTPRQQLLQHLLGYPTPAYAHLPVITDSRGHKFSKQSHAAPLQDTAATLNLRRALAFLQQAQAPAAVDTVADLLDHALAHWSPAAVPHAAAMTARD